MIIHEDWQERYLKASNGLTLNSSENEVLLALCKTSELTASQIHTKSRVAMRLIHRTIKSLSEKITVFSIESTGIVQKQFYLK